MGGFEEHMVVIHDAEKDRAICRTAKVLGEWCVHPPFYKELMDNSLWAISHYTPGATYEVTSLAWAPTLTVAMIAVVALQRVHVLTNGQGRSADFGEMVAVMQVLADAGVDIAVPSIVQMAMVSPSEWIEETRTRWTL